MNAPRVLVAGVGNLFLGDDAFGGRVIRSLGREPLPEGVRVQDFGTRGYDLVLELLQGYDLVVMVDAAQAGGPPGTVYVIDPAADPLPEAVPSDPHGLAPEKVLALAKSLGARWKEVRVLGCEPGSFEPDADGALSPSVEAAVEPAVRRLRELVETFVAAGSGHA